MSGDPKTARRLHEDVLRRSRTLADDHPAKLAVIAELGSDLRALGELEAAQRLHQDAHDRARLARGEDHPDTLAYAAELAADLRALGDSDTAQRLSQDTLSRRRRVLGDDHPDTRFSVRAVAAGSLEHAP